VLQQPERQHVAAHSRAADRGRPGAQARQVRQSAAENLGELTRMSMRVDNLANDLVASACAAEPSGREAYLTALRGLLATSGARLSPAVISKAGNALRQLMDGAGASPAAALAGRVAGLPLHGRRA
jgi:hypothetical protein